MIDPYKKEFAANINNIIKKEFAVYNFFIMESVMAAQNNVRMDSEINAQMDSEIKENDVGVGDKDEDIIIRDSRKCNA